jgi:ABC-type nitrate/sulfonate/bicarbonate transport system substrate-binding protein
MAIEEGAFEERGILPEWTDVPEGSGRMCEMLRENRADLAIILTEGVVKSISEGNPVRIVQEYVSSPLLWGIHVAAGSPYNNEGELQQKKAAISRPGSGSHLMAFLHAQNLGWDTESLGFETVNNLQGAVTALTEGSADYFMWEHFTTKPLVNQGIFRRLGDFPTPWPCFVIAARIGLLQEQPGLVRHVLEVINMYTEEFRHIPSIDRTLANRYRQEVADIRDWLGKTRWSQGQISIDTIENVIDILYHLKLIVKKIPPGEFLYP